MHQMRRRTVREPSLKLACDGEGRRDDGLSDAKSRAEPLRERGLAGAKRTGQQQHVASTGKLRQTLPQRLHVLAGGGCDGNGVAHAARPLRLISSMDRSKA